jgi:hypothetical protein
MDSKDKIDIDWQAEDSLREKKVESDLKDLLKTLVAFANFCRTRRCGSTLDR